MARKPVPIVIVQGAQWGSEGKGMVAAALGERRNISIAVRTGTVNAGHTVYYNGRAYKMQQLPVGWTNPSTRLVIGAGAYIHPIILNAEIIMIAEATGTSVLDVCKRIFIDHRAGLHLPIHTDMATRADRSTKIGATGKGCSEAVVDKIRNRGAGSMLFVDWMREYNPTHLASNCYIGDMAKWLNDRYDDGADQAVATDGSNATAVGDVERAVAREREVGHACKLGAHRWAAIAGEPDRTVPGDDAEPPVGQAHQHAVAERGASTGNVGHIERTAGGNG